jgi:hypothetical protein
VKAVQEKVPIYMGAQGQWCLKLQEKYLMEY